VVGGIVYEHTIHFEPDIPFADFFSRVCAHMDIPVSNAQLGFKYDNDKICAPPRNLSTADHLREAMTQAVAMMRRARTRLVYITLHNLI
ncbi:hypothetical protein PENSPDRAFT_566025, partial [Peniophora sp. CONT]